MDSSCEEAELNILKSILRPRDVSPVLLLIYDWHL